jgi:hypothetical protein
MNLEDLNRQDGARDTLCEPFMEIFLLSRVSTRDHSLSTSFSIFSRCMCQKNSFFRSNISHIGGIEHAISRIVAKL